MWIVSLLGGVRATIFALAGAALLLGLGVQTERLKLCQQHYEAQALAAHIAQANADVLTASNASKDAALLELQQQLDTLTGLKQQVETARDAALTALATAEKQRNKALADATNARRILYAHDAASAAWAQQPTTRGITDQLRDDWSAGRGDQGPSDLEAGAPVRADPGTAARYPAASATTAAGVRDCRDGCYSNDQLLSAVGSCVATLSEAQSRLHAIATLEARAIAPSQKPET